MSLTKEDLKNIKDLFKEKFESIDNKFLNFDKRFENLEEILARNFELIANHFKTIEEDIEYLKEKGNLYELSFNKMNERLDCIDRNILELRARENLNRDILNSKEKEYSK